MRELIINAPSVQTLWQRSTSVIFTFVFWVVWFFLWIPLATLIAWYLGIDLVYFQMFELDGFRIVMKDFFRFIQVVGLLGGTLGLWAAYNYLRFKGREKRKALPQLSEHMLADYLGIDIEMLKGYQQERALSVKFDDSGRILAITRLQEATDEGERKP